MHEVLLAAAVIGVDDFELAVLGPVTGLSKEQLRRAVQAARAARIAADQETHDGFSFAHALVREVLYSDADPAHRTQLHRRVAEVIDDRYGDTRVVDVAHHTLNGLAGSDDDDAADLAVRAAESQPCRARLRGCSRVVRGGAVTWLRDRRPDDLRVGGLLVRCGEARVGAETSPVRGPHSPTRLRWPWQSR